MNYPRLRFLLALTALILLAGCGNERADGEGDDRRETGQITLSDAKGGRISLSGPAKRIVSLAPNITEILFAIGAGERVIGRTAFCDYPPSAAAVEVVGDFQRPNFERIVALHPDLVLMSAVGNLEEAYRKFGELSINAFVLEAATIEGTIEAIDTIGTITGLEPNARRISDGLRRQIDSIRSLAAASPNVSVFVVIDKSPLISVSKGFLAEAIEIAGGDNIAKGSVAQYPTFSREEVVRRNPEVVILVSPAPNAVEEILELYPEWGTLGAVRAGKIYRVDPDLLSRPGPRIGDGIDLLFRTLHGKNASL